ncbi:MAG TPA: hypothetical protein VJ728_16095 [Candidatus Binataceae bacterium]|nr:hypothetical protein [Candidatus Binataceae bacterium]
MCANLPRQSVVAFLFAIVYGCAPVAMRSASAPSPSVPVAFPIPAVLSANDVTGVWQGRSFADCPIVTTDNPGRCGAMQHITFTMFQNGASISGSYKCAFGNENCRDLAETGVIRNGRMIDKLLRLAVMLDDGSMCRFTGMPHDGILQGRYQCHWGGPMEQGGFRVERSY